jgi:hypothetical protein
MENGQGIASEGDSHTLYEGLSRGQGIFRACEIQKYLGDVLNPYSTRGEIPLITTKKGLPINNRKARWAERARRNCA